MVWLLRADALTLPDLVSGLFSNEIQTKKDINLYLKGLYKSNSLYNLGKPIEIDERIVGKGKMSLTQDQLKYFINIVRERFENFPGKEEFENPFQHLLEA